MFIVLVEIIMIDFNSLKIGDEVFYVIKTLDLDKHKISMIDNDGTEWFRYMNPRPYMYQICSYTLVGKVSLIIEGKVADHSYDDNSWHFETSDKGDIHYYFLHDNDSFFYTKKDAQEFISEQQKGG